MSSAYANELIKLEKFHCQKQKHLNPWDAGGIIGHAIKWILFKLFFFLWKGCRELHLKNHPISRVYFPSGASWVEYTLNSANPTERQHDLLGKQFMKSNALWRSSKSFNCDVPIYCWIHYFPLNAFAHKWKTKMIQEMGIVKKIESQRTLLQL